MDTYTTDQIVKKALSERDSYKKLKVSGNSVRTWRYRFNQNTLSLEKQIHIAELAGYELQKEMVWVKKEEKL